MAEERADGLAMRPANGKGKLRLLSRRQLDQRTRSAKVFNAIARGVAADLGGKDQLSTVQHQLTEAFAGICVHVSEMNARLLLGQPVDLTAHATAVSTMVRVASRIGLERVARDVTPPRLSDYLRQAERVE